MKAESGKVHKLECVKGETATKSSEIPDGRGFETGVLQAQKDMSKVAMIVSLLVVLLLVIFFFGMNRNIAGLSNEVKSLGVLREDIANLDQRVVKMQKEIPSEMKRMLAYDVVNEMTMKAVYLKDALDDAALRSKMQQVLAGLKEVREGLEK